LNSGSTSMSSGGGRTWPCMPARQWRHTDRTLARSERQGRKRSTTPRMSGWRLDHSDTLASNSDLDLVCGIPSNKTPT
jgi:hypothetical protein